MFVLILIAITLAVVLAMAIGIYNALVSPNAQVDRAWANIDVILKQRFDELPQLIQVIEQYASCEQKTLLKIIDARNGSDMFFARMLG